MDETDVKEFSMTYYGDLYPEEYKYKYPKAGEANSLVDIYVYDVENSKAVKLMLAAIPTNIFLAFTGHTIKINLWFFA